MFDYEASGGEKRADWSGTVIGALISPVLIVFMCLGKPEVGFNAYIGLGAAAVAVKLRWELRRHAWFWGAALIALGVQVPLVFVVHWPHTKVPTLVYAMPIGLCSYALVAAAIRIAARIFSKDDSPSDEQT